MEGQKVSCLRFDGAALANADFRASWLIHPETKKHMGMSSHVVPLIASEESAQRRQLEETFGKREPLLEHLKPLFQNAFTKGEPLFSDDTNDKFIENLKRG